MFTGDRSVGAFVRKYCLEFFLDLYDGKAFCFPSLQNGQDILGSYFRCRNEFEIEPSVFESLRAGNGGRLRRAVAETYAPYGKQ